MKAGSLDLKLIPDGIIKLDGGAVFGQIAKVLWESLARPDRRNRIRLGLNCLLIQSPQGNILVNTGIGKKQTQTNRDRFGAHDSRLLRNLRALGQNPKSINYVILTDLRTQHAGGSTKLNRKGEAVATFPEARYLIQRTAWEEGVNPNERYRSWYHSDDFLPLESTHQMDLISGDHEVVPGVWLKEVGGPSRGHQIVLINHSSTRIAFLGDLIPTPYHLSLPYISAMDQFPEKSLDSKRQLLEMIEREGWLMIFPYGYENLAGFLRRRNGQLSLTPTTI